MSRTDITADGSAVASTGLLYAYILAAIGFGLMVGWDIMGLFAPGLALLAYATPAHALLLCVVGIAAAAVSYGISYLFAAEMASRCIGLTALAGVCGIGAAVLALAYELGASAPPIALAIVMWIAFGCGKALFCVMWATYLSAIPTKHTGVAIGAGAMLGSAIYAALTVTTGPLTCLVGAVLLPLASAVVLIVLLRTAPARELAVEQPRPPRPLSALASVSLSAQGAVYGFITFYICTYDPAAAPIVGSSGIVGCALVIVLTYLAPRTDFDNSIVQRISLPVIVIGLALIALLDHDGKIVCACITNCGLAFASMMAWANSCTENAEFHLQPIARFAGRQGPLWAGLFVGSVLTFALHGQLLSDERALFYATSALIIFAVVAFSLYGADDSEAKRQLEGLMTVDGPDAPSAADPALESALAPTFQETCDEVCERFGLSPREREVFYLLAKGRNAKFIQEDLGISASTVKTHIYRIYRKMGISSQQLLIDTVDREIAGGGAPARAK